MTAYSVSVSRSLRCPLIVGFVVCLLALAGCTSGSDSETAKAESPKPGGTLYVMVESADFPHIDPQRTHYTPAMNVVRLFARTLTTYRPAPGSKGSELVPDLATDLGRPTDGNTVWRFTLKPGVKWQDGKPVTCADVKYGVERSFAEEIDGGASIYPRTYLRGGDDYAGPYVMGNNNGLGLESVKCLDDRTVQFELSRPVGDFSYVVALPVFAPARADKDTREQYDRQPFANGPYQVHQYGEDDNGRMRLVLKRNPHWDQRTDPARKQYPETIEVRFGEDANRVTQKMIADEGEYRYAVALDAKVPPRFVQEVINDPKLAARTISGTTSGVRYLAINTRVVDELACRQALTYAFDKRAFRTVLGGSPYGDYAATILPPTMKAHADFDLYNTKAKPQGDLERARLLASGADCPEELTLGYAGTPVNEQAADVIVESYQKLGIRVVKQSYPAEEFYDAVSVPSEQPDLVLTGWVPDFPNGSGTIPVLFDGRSISASGNRNYSLVNDEELNRLIDEANAEADLNRQYRLWGQLDHKIQEKALVVPILYDRALQMVGSRVRGGFLHTAYLGVDLSSLGVA